MRLWLNRLCRTATELDPIDPHVAAEQRRENLYLYADLIDNPLPRSVNLTGDLLPLPQSSWCSASIEEAVSSLRTRWALPSAVQPRPHRKKSVTGEGFKIRLRT